MNSINTNNEVVVITFQIFVHPEVDINTNNAVVVITLIKKLILILILIICYTITA